MKWRLSGIALSAALLVETYFLLHDIPLLRQAPLSAGLGAAEAPPIAELVEMHQVVRVQSPRDLLWEEASAGRTLRQSESLMTSAGSTAAIAFLDGTGLVLGESSLIVLERNPSGDGAGYQKIIVRLLRGRLSKNLPRGQSELLRRLGGGAGGRTPALEIRAGEAVLAPAPSSEFNLRTEGPGRTLALEVSDGKVDVTPAAQAPLRTVQAGQRAEISPQAKGLAVDDEAVTPLTPAEGQTLTQKTGEKTLKLRWKSADGTAAPPLAIELSRSADFSTVEKRISAAAATGEAEVAMPAVEKPELWHWRIGTGPSRSFWLAPEPRPETLFPLAQSRGKPREAIRFSWSAGPLAARASAYEVEIDGVKRIDTTETFAQVADLAPGMHPWRVRVRLKDGSVSAWSASRLLEITEDTRKVSLPPPPSELLDPEILDRRNHQRRFEAPRGLTPAPSHTWLERFFDVLLPSAVADDDRGEWDIQLRWRAVEGVKRYRIQIARDRGFSHVISEEETSQPVFDFPFKAGMENSKGRLFYRVASMSETGEVGAYSSAKTIPIPSAISDQATDQATGQAGPTSISTPPPEPAPIGKTEAQVMTLRHTRQTLDWSLALDTGIGNLAQSSATPDFKSVSLDSPYLHQKIRFEAELTRASESETHLEERQWLAALQADLASFEQSADGTPALQPKVKAVGFRLDAFSQSLVPHGGWKTAGGLSLGRDYRFVKNGPQEVDPEGALGLGPSAHAVRNYEGGRGFAPAQVGGELDLPVTGLFLGGYYGIEGSVWSEWRLIQFQRGSLGIQLALEVRAQKWKDPSGTSLSAWTLWIAPVFHFGHSDEDTLPSLPAPRRS